MLQLALVARLPAPVGADHRLSVAVLPEAQRGVQDGAQFLQEGRAGAKKLLRGQQDDENQDAVGDVLRDFLGAVQAVPATLFCVAALVAQSIGVVVNAVGFIYRIAHFFLGSAVEVVVETESVVTGLVALAVVKSSPAARVCTFGPGIHCQGAVAAVPVASKRVALLVADAVVDFAAAVR